MAGQMSCGDPDCPLLQAVVAPLTTGDRVVGSLAAYDSAATTGLVRLVGEVARWVSTQLELAEWDRAQTRLAHREGGMAIQAAQVDATADQLVAGGADVARRHDRPRRACGWVALSSAMAT